MPLPQICLLIIINSIFYPVLAQEQCLGKTYPLIYGEPGIESNLTCFRENEWDGSYLVGGHTKSDNMVGSRNANQFGSFISYFTYEGVIKWAKQFVPGSYSDWNPQIQACDMSTYKNHIAVLQNYPLAVIILWAADGGVVTARKHRFLFQPDYVERAVSLNENSAYISF